MSSSDQQKLENAYMQVIEQQSAAQQPPAAEQPAPEINASSEEQTQLDEGLKGAVAAGLMGLGAMGGLKAADVPYHTSLQTYEQAVEDIKSEKAPTEEQLTKIAANKDLAKRFAHFMVVKGHKLPDILRKVVGDVDKEIEASVVGG